MSEDAALPLGYVEQPNPPPRPSLRNPAVRRAAAEDLLPDIVDWMGKDWRESGREEVIADLMTIVGESDGYRAARNLELRHWEVNAALVELLDDDLGYKAVRDATLAWVAANGITPRLAIGQTVKTPWGTGPIVSVYPDEATYTVRTDQFLEKTPGQAGKNSGYVVPFEKCEALP